MKFKGIKKAIGDRNRNIKSKLCDYGSFLYNLSTHEVYYVHLPEKEELINHVNEITSNENIIDISHELLVYVHQDGAWIPYVSRRINMQTLKEFLEENYGD